MYRGFHVRRQQRFDLLDVGSNGNLREKDGDAGMRLDAAGVGRLD
jgi:hypothetical protein